MHRIVLVLSDLPEDADVFSPHSAAAAMERKALSLAFSPLKLSLNNPVAIILSKFLLPALSTSLDDKQ